MGTFTDNVFWYTPKPCGDLLTNFECIGKVQFYYNPVTFMVDIFDLRDVSFLLFINYNRKLKKYLIYV